ncbi:MAG: hypothetical protein IJT12_02520 [Paludibacteraceae bacterium]|nr:hypothetical protein [Paludibacteraceae bacterium]
MKRNLSYSILTVMAAVVLTMTACTERQEVTDRVALPLTISLPVDDNYRPNQQAQRRRVMGDPGTTEEFLLPQHLYYFVMRQVGATWKVWQAVDAEPQAEEWLKKRYSGSLQTAGDSVYQYTKMINLLLKNEGTFVGRVYAIASAQPLTFNADKDFDELNFAGMDLDDVLDLTFNTSSTTIQQNLQNIYSSPYNYNVSGDYYGAFSNKDERLRVPHVHLMLYHVASKVDIKWNVQEDKRINRETPSEGVRLTYMEARRLYNAGAYCFRPMRNTKASLPSSGYDIPDIVTESDEGLWWEGRSYFYTIPYIVESDEDYFPLQLLMRTNGSAGSGYQLTLKQPIDTADVFVPWIRGNFNLTKPLDNTTAVKTAD